MLRKYRYEVGYITHPGYIRTENQDSLLIHQGSIDGDDFLLLAVADGMGGLSHGAQASSFVIHSLDQWWSEQLPALIKRDLEWTQLSDSLIVTIEAANWSLFQNNQTSGERSGTTLSMVFLFQGNFRIFQVGDSRIYAIEGGKASQLTQDQTWCQMEINAGRLTAEQASTHPRRHTLVSALGTNETYMLGHMEGTMRPASSMLLCSDGFYHELPKRWPEQISTKIPVQTSLNKLSAYVLNGAAPDNLTAILIRMAKR